MDPGPPGVEPVLSGTRGSQRMVGSGASSSVFGRFSLLASLPHYPPRVAFHPFSPIFPPRTFPFTRLRLPPLPPLYSPLALPCHPNLTPSQASGAVGGSARHSWWVRASAGSGGSRACPPLPEIFSFFSTLPHFRKFGMGGWGEWLDGGMVGWFRF